MKKWPWLFLLPLAISCFALALSIAAFKKARSEDQHFRAKLLHLVRQCVLYNSSLSDKEKILDLLKQIEEHEYFVETGSDDLRVKYVSSQACIEHVLACSQALGEVVDLIGMIHTPMPATPLCTKPEPLDDSLLDPSIRFDLDKLLTVHSRAKIIREYLIKGGVLYIVYPRGGLEKRSPQQQAIYQEELLNYPHQLFDWVLDTTQLHPEMGGATYFFKNQIGDIFVFSIKAPQASHPENRTEWGLWLGEVKNPFVKQRVAALFDYFQGCGGPTKKHFHFI